MWSGRLPRSVDLRSTTDLRAGPGNDGVVLRLIARFDASGPTGAWSVVEAWGSVEGMRGAGKLAGEPFPGGIEDVCVGTATFR